MIPGEVVTASRDIILNENRRTETISIVNTGDRPIQVGSHYHFFEVNKLLSFPRDKAFGMRLDIPSGTSVRFEPGETKTVQLVEVGGTHRMFGLNNLTRAQVNAATIKKSMHNAELNGFVK